MCRKRFLCFHPFILLLISSQWPVVSQSSIECIIPPPGTKNVISGKVMPYAYTFKGTNRFLVILGRGYLKQLSNCKITRMELRYKNTKIFGVGKGILHFKVYFSNKDTLPSIDKVSEEFSKNAGSDETKVFDGDVVLTKKDPYLGPGEAPWGHVNNIFLDLNPGFVYKGKALCIDVQIRVVKGEPFWFWELLKINNKIKPAYSGFKTPGTLPSFKPILNGKVPPGYKTGLFLAGIPCFAVPFSIIGTSNKYWYGGGLPLFINNDLALNVSPDLSLMTPAKKIDGKAKYDKEKKLLKRSGTGNETHGSASLDIEIPNLPSLYGAKFFCQFFSYGLLDKKSRPVLTKLGSTKAMEMVIGNGSRKLEGILLAGGSKDNSAPLRAKTKTSLVLPRFRLIGKKVK